MEFEWSAEKARTNLKKHGVSFEDAARAFFDTGRLEMYDGRENYGEDRWAVVGSVKNSILYVVYTVPDDEVELIRIISARRANAQERKRYGQAKAGSQ